MKTMNDTELDEILDSWTTPQAPASLRERMQTGFSDAMERETIPIARMSWKTAFARRARKGLLAVAVVALGAFVLVVTQAIPQTLRLVSPPVQVPYVVDSEFVQYASDGAPVVVMHTTSYSQDGKEVLLSRTLPGNPIGTAIARTYDAGFLHIGPVIHPPWSRFPLEEKERRRALLADPNHIGLLTGCDWPMCWVPQQFYFTGIGDPRTGCAAVGAVGHETILNYPTVAAQRGAFLESKRITLSMAPDLGCFALKETLEERGPDGAFRLVSGKQALNVTWNP
jgi:hypothetical protein